MTTFTAAEGFGSRTINGRRDGQFFQGWVPDPDFTDGASKAPGWVMFGWYDSWSNMISGLWYAPQTPPSGPSNTSGAFIAKSYRPAQEPCFYFDHVDNTIKTLCVTDPGNDLG
jgi:hypothetical protein